MKLGLGTVAKAAIGIAGATVIAVGTGAVATGVDGPPAWAVSVRSADHLLFPGTAASIPYELENTTAGLQRLHGTTVQLRTNRAGCLAQWFRVVSNTVSTDVDLAAGQSVKGTVRLAFVDAPVSQDACQNVGIDVVIAAT